MVFAPLCYLGPSLRRSAIPDKVDLRISPLRFFPTLFPLEYQVRYGLPFPCGINLCGPHSCETVVYWAFTGVLDSVPLQHFFTPLSPSTPPPFPPQRSLFLPSSQKWHLSLPVSRTYVFVHRAIFSTPPLSVAFFFTAFLFQVIHPCGISFHSGPRGTSVEFFRFSPCFFVCVQSFLFFCFHKPPYKLIADWRQLLQ